MDQARQREVVAWLEAELVDVEIERVEEARVRPWSSQLKIFTSDGLMWFKANCAAQSFEPAFQRLLADLVPDAFDVPVAVDASRGWLVTADRGATWGEQSEPDLNAWLSLVVEAAHIQQKVAGSADRILAAGVPDCSPATVPDRFDRLVTLMSQVPNDHPSHLTTEDRYELLDHRTNVVAAAEALSNSALPATWQHGDLHPWNVFMVDGRPRLFDLGDSQWAHALEILAVPFGWITQRTELDWSPLIAAYAQAWDLSADDVAVDWQASQLTQAVNRALTWWSCLADATVDEWSEWGDAPVYHLKRVLGQ